jgi:RHS repeat-associated protein
MKGALIAMLATGPGLWAQSNDASVETTSVPASGASNLSGTTPAPLRFVPVTPCRVADTRNAAGAFGGPAITGGTSRSFTIPASSCSIPSTAQGYSLNVAAVPAGPLGFLTLWPTGQTQPVASTLNSLDGRIKSNAAIVPAGTGGAISVFASNTTHVILDINGYFIPASNPTGLAFFPVTPCRVADTRNGTLISGPFAGGTSRTLPIQSSSCGIPPTAQAYSLNFVVVATGQVGFLTAWPTGQTRPVVATLNALPPTTPVVVANAAIVPAGTSGSIDVFASNATDLVVDINGYFAPIAPGGLSLYGVTPCRVLDTRQPPGSPPVTGSLDVAVAASACGISPSAQADVLSVTVVPSGPLGFLTLWPQGQVRPTVASLNALDGAITSNLAIVPDNITNGSISLFPSNPTHVVMDISGYFGPGPEITNFSPTTAPVGDSVTVTGNNFTPDPGSSVQVTLNQTGGGTVAAQITASTATSITFTIPALAANGPITITVNGQTATSSTTLTIGSSGTGGTGTPTILFVTSNTGFPGQSEQVVITALNTSFVQGTTTANFGAGIAVGGAAQGVAGPVTVTSPSTATANLTIDAAAATGARNVVVTTAAQSASLAGGFSVVTPTGQPPAITSFTPGSGPIGTAVTLTGTNLLSPGGTPADLRLAKLGGGIVSAPLTSATATSISFVIPSTAATGTITAVTTGGTATSASALTVTPSSTFTVTAAPSTLSLIAGQTATYTITLASTNGFTGLAQMGLSGLPTGITASFSPKQIAAGQQSILTVTAPGTQGSSSSTLTITGAATVDGLPEQVTANAGLIVSPITTSFVGRTVVDDTNHASLAGVKVTMLGKDGSGGTTGCTGTTTSDASGNFALTSLPTSCVGPQLVGFDGTTVTSPPGTYAGVDLVFTLVANQVVASPVLVHLPRIDNVETFMVTQNSTQDQTYAFRSIPGLSVTVYAGTVFTKADGTQPNPFPLAAIQVPVDRLPDQIPVTTASVNAFIVAFQPANTTASKAVAVWFPNTLNTPPGTNVPLATLDPTRGRMVPYGTGTVSNDGTTIIPDVDPSTGSLQHRYGIVHFDWHGPTPPGPPNNPGGGGGGPGTGGNVDLASGLEVFSRVDLGIQGNRGSIRIIRTYRSLSNEIGPFGLGGNFNLNVRISSATPQTQATLNLIMPDGNRLPFVRQPSGSLICTTIPSMLGAVMSTSSNGASTIAFKDGTTFGFTPASFPVGSVLVSITDPNGNTTAVARNPANPVQITSITDPAGRQLLFTYDSSNRITAITDPIGRQVSYTYDASSNLTSVTDAAGGVWKYQYNAQNQLVQTTDARGIVSYQNTYDANGRVNTQTTADGGVLRFAYTITNPLVPNSPVVQTTVTNQLGNQYVYRFNTVGFVTDVTDPNGQTRHFARDPGTNMVTHVSGGGLCPICGDPALGDFGYTYDQSGNLLTQTDALGNTWANTFDPSTNQVLTRTDPLGNVTRFGYDGRGNVTSLKDQKGNTFTYTYDGNGLLLTVTDPQGAVTKNTYDALGNLSAVTDQLNNVTSYSYDGASRVLQIKNQLGNVKTLSYDPLDRTISVTDGNGRKNTLAYDSLGGLTSVTDALNRTTTFVRDSLDRLVQRKDALGRTLSYSYDLAGRLTTQTDRLGNAQLFGYDSANRLVSETYADATVQRSYDADSRLVQITDSQGGTFTYSYDPAGRLLKTVTPLGTLTLTRDPLGRVATRQVSGQPIQTVTYDAVGNLTGAAMPQASVAIAYDTRNLRTSITRSTGVKTSFTYDAAGRLLSKVTANGAVNLNVQSYSYDGLGRRTSVTNDISQPLATQSAVGGAYDSANELTGLGATVYTNDANGNRLAANSPSGNTSYAWDARGRLAVVLTPNGQTITNLYDPAGNLIRYRVTASASSLTQSFVLDDLANIAFQGSSDPAQQFSMLTGEGIDEYFAAVDSTGSPHYGVTGNLGNIIANSGNSKAIDGTASYEPFGQTSISNTAYPIGYSGRVQVSPNLYYFRTRFYDPAAGRFLSEDKAGLLGGWNLYEFNQNDPINHADPEGLWAGIDDGIAIVGGGIAGVIGQGIGDLITGSSPNWEDYAGAFVGGAASGETLLYTGNPWLAGAAGGAAGNLTKQGLKNLTGKQCGFDWGSLAYDTGTGALTGLIPGNQIPGVTSGRNSWAAIAKSTSTKLENGTISNISAQTYGKALGANLGGAIDQIGGAGAFGGGGNLLFPAPGCK